MGSYFLQLASASVVVHSTASTSCTCVQSCIEQWKRSNPKIIIFVKVQPVIKALISFPIASKIKLQSTYLFCQRAELYYRAFSNPPKPPEIWGENRHSGTPWSWLKNRFTCSLLGIAPSMCQLVSRSWIKIVWGIVDEYTI